MGALPGPGLHTQFPDPRLVQYDCGKLQALDALLRRLRAGGHRVLIFTQMTRMLDVLERFLTFHGHIYLRLDGSTRVEQRQLTPIERYAMNFLEASLEDVSREELKQAEEQLEAARKDIGQAKGGGARTRPRPGPAPPGEEPEEGAEPEGGVASSERGATDDATLHLVNRFWAQAWAGPEEGVAAPPPPRLSFAPEAVARLGGALGRAQRGLQHLGGHLSARPELPEPGRELLRELLREHRRLQELTLALHEKHQREALQLAELQDKAGWAETKVLELGTTLEGLQWDSAKLRKREGRLDRHLAEALEQLTSGSYGCGSSGGFQGGQITLSVQKFEMLNAELEGNQELANSRMAELEKLQLELQAAVRGQERLKVALRSLPEEAVKEALEYKVLQSQFSLLYHESLQVKTQLDEARALLLATKNSHLRHIEHMEVGPARPPHLWVSPRGVPRGFWGDSGASGVREMARIGIQDGRRCHKWRKAVSKMAAGGISPTMPYSRWRPVPQIP
ncbi:E3 ubiquitin-protein ligase BRE1B [Lonchura striata]|uniref:E3 ubiquitin-protein ligase BRE1B n=1 Tax=Lonchura striata TaxID=40157 RepID=A0A218U7Y1_9PASE|nr:E3 ubiquitin-protein ligase BRE1B [Lonchura striata domestica]